MTIEFTNAERTEAIITRGWWLWKRCARVVLVGDTWQFAVNGRKATDYCWDLAHAKAEAENPTRDPWERVQRLPQARLRDGRGGE